MNFVSIWTPGGNKLPAKGFWRWFGAYQLLWQDSFACCVALRFFESLGKCLPGEFILAAKPDFNKFTLDEEKKKPKPVTNRGCYKETLESNWHLNSDSLLAEEMC